MTAPLTIVAEYVERPFECPACFGEGVRTKCPPRCDGSHVFDRDYPCDVCDRTGAVPFIDPSDEDLPAEVAA